MQYVHFAEIYSKIIVIDIVHVLIFVVQLSVKQHSNGHRVQCDCCVLL